MSENQNFTLYDAVYNDLKTKIVSGYYASGEKLPTIAQLCEMYRTSDATIRRSLEILKLNNYVYSVKRVGIFVADKQQTKLEFSFHESYSIKNKTDRCELLSVERLQDADSVQFGHNNCLKVERLYFKGVLPVYFKINYLPLRAKMIQGGDKNHQWIDEMDYVFDSYSIQKKLSVTVDRDERVKRLLYISDHMPMIKILKSFYTFAGNFEGIAEIYVFSEEVNFKLHQK